MSRRTVRVRTFSAVLACLAGVGLSIGPVPSAGAASARPQSADADQSADAAARNFAAAELRRMTIEEKVGQLFVTNVYGDRADTTTPADVAANQALYGVDNGAQFIAKYKPGGIIYFAWTNSVNNPPQIAGLSNGLQRVAVAQRSRIPLLISTDQEQGVVFRVGPPATQFPGNMALGAGRSAKDAQSAATIGGKELQGSRHQPELRAGRRRQRQRIEPQ